MYVSSSWYLKTDKITEKNYLIDNRAYNRVFITFIQYLFDVNELQKKKQKKRKKKRKRKNVNVAFYEISGVDLDAGSIIGIVVGALVLLLIVFILIFARATGRWCFAGECHIFPINSH